MFRAIILRLGLRYSSRRLLQSVLFIIGVALGVAVVIAVDLANSSASRAFALSGESITGKATHQIIGGSQDLPTALYNQIRLDVGIRDSAPVVTAYVRGIETADRPLRLLGVDPFAEPPFRTYLSEVEVMGETGSAFEAITRFIAEPNTALISQTLADRFNLQAGSLLTLRVGTGEQAQVRIIGILQPSDSASQQALDDLLLTDIATAQDILNRTGRISRIDLILPDDFDTTPITSLLPENAALVSVVEENSTLEQLTAAFEINLQALSLLAVVVGVFLIYNTVTFSVVQRRPAIGILRSLGATKGQIFAFVIGEAFMLGLVGTVLGMGLGIIFGRLTVGLVAQTISDLYFTINVTTITVDPLTLLKGAALGIFASVGAAIVPSLDATRTSPAGTLKRSVYEERITRLLPFITLAAVLFLIVGYVLLQVPTENLYISFGALFCVIFGGALFTPLLLKIGMQIALPITAAIFGVTGRMAPRAVTRSLSRTAVAVAALTIAVSVIVGVSVMIGSFRSTVADWLGTTLGADIFISPPLTGVVQAQTNVDPEIRNLVSAVEGVERVSASRRVQVQAPDYPDLLPVTLLAVDFDISQGRNFVWNAAPNGDTETQLRSGNFVMVSEPFAFRRGITRDNNQLRLTTDTGIQTFEVIAVYYDYSTDQGTVHISRTIYDQYWNDPYISTLAAFVTPGTEITTVIDALQRDALAGYDLQIQSNRSLREGVFAIFERTFTITIALRLLATLVAFIGILSALLALQLEHTREYGVMRATGMTPRQLWQYTLVQTGLMGVVAGILALPIGWLLALVLIYVINVRSFGWTMQLSLQPTEFLTAFAVAVVAALLAGLYPAYQLGKMNMARALRSE